MGLEIKVKYLFWTKHEKNQVKLEMRKNLSDSIKEKKSSENFSAPKGMSLLKHESRNSDERKKRRRQNQNCVSENRTSRTPKTSF